MKLPKEKSLKKSGFAVELGLQFAGTSVWKEPAGSPERCAPVGHEPSSVTLLMLHATSPDSQTSHILLSV